MVGAASLARGGTPTLRVIKGTWSATTLFVLALLVPWGMLLGWRYALWFGLIALVLTPPIWWWLVARGQRLHPAGGALAGLLIAPLTHLGWLTCFYFEVHDPKYRYPGLAGAINIGVAVIVVMGGAIATLLGVLLGMLAVFVQKRWPKRA